jgi:hypothetical protein
MRLPAQEGETGRSAAKMRRRVLVLLLVLGPMEILRGRGKASFGVEYEYEGRKGWNGSTVSRPTRFRCSVQTRPRRTAPTV